MFAGIFRKLSKRRSESRSRGKLESAVRVALEPLENRAYMSFTAPVSYPASSGTVAMVTADVNNDGSPDVIMSNSPASLTAMLGNGDGTFQAPQITSLTSNPGSNYTGSQAGTLTTGDFNGDGRVDVATVTAGTYGIVALGNGDGTFAAMPPTYLGSSPTRITAADVNADGYADLMVANTGGTVSVLLGHADGTLSAPASYLAGAEPQDVKAVDMNHDGKLDLVVANAVSQGTVTVLLGNGDGSFKPYTSYYAFSAPYRMQVADFNNDGNMDVCVANSYTSSFVTILLGNGDGTLQGYHSYDTGSQPWELDAVDVDGDGKADLVDSNGSTYQIEMNNGDGTFSAPTSMPGAGLAFAADDFNRDGVADIAGANLSNVGVMLNTTVAATNIGATVGFNVSAPATTGAGAALPLTITAVDANGNTVPDFLGTVHVTTTDPRMSGLTYTFVAADAGTHTFNAALYTLGAQTITVTGPMQLTGSTTVNVGAAAAARFSVTAGATSVAGSPVSFTVSAQDSFGNLAASYTGTVHFSSSDVQAGLPADYTFTLDDAGVHTFSAVLKNAGSQTIRATDTTSATTTGNSSAVLVTPSVATSLGIVGGGGHIGSPHTVTVTAYDAFGNVATGNNTTIHLSASDPQMVLPADGSLTNGVGVFTVTPMTLGTQTLTATDTSGGVPAVTETITGTPGDAVRFTMTPVSNAVAGTTQSVTITAYDAFGNVAVDYGGTVRFTSTDLQAALPTYTFTAADLGTHTFAVALRTAGSQSITAADLFNGTISVTQTGINVTPGAATSVSVTSLHATVAGVSQQVTISARDAYGNIATSYAGTVSFASSDTQAVLPAAYTFTAADAGAHTFDVTLKSAGGQTFTVTDAISGVVLSAQRDINVSAAAMAGFAFRSPSNTTAGVAFSVTLSAVDAFGNTVSGYTGTVHFSGPSGGGNLLPADYTFTAADAGVHVFSLTFSSTGMQTVNVADTLNNKLKGSFSVSVKTGATSTGGGGGGTSTGGGGTGGGGGGGGKKIVV